MKYDVWTKKDFFFVVDYFIKKHQALDVNKYINKLLIQVYMYQLVQIPCVWNDDNFVRRPGEFIGWVNLNEMLWKIYGISLIIQQ